MSQTPDQLKELGRIFTAVGSGAQWQYQRRGFDEWIAPTPNDTPLAAIEAGLHIRLKPVRVPLGPEDVPPMSVLRNLRRYPQTAWVNFTCVNASGVCMGDTGRSYAQLMSEDWEIQRPGEDWKPCSKEPT